MFFRTDRDPDGLYDENRLLRLLLRAFGLRSSDPDTIGQLIRAMVPEHGPFPPCEKGAVPDGRIRPAEKAARFRMPEKYIYPYTPKCSVAWAFSSSALFFKRRSSSLFFLSSSSSSVFLR